MPQQRSRSEGFTSVLISIVAGRPGFRVRAMFFTVLVLFSLGSAPALAQRPVSVNTLAWLVGCWETAGGTRLVEEQWMVPRGGTMLGMSRTTRGDTLLDFEFTQIVEDSAGLVYVARPARQPQASFRSVQLTDSLVVFENPEHDFPQRIIYRRAADGSMAARIEGTLKGKLRSVDFPYKQVACP